jgi:hypothetical protein
LIQKYLAEGLLSKSAAEGLLSRLQYILASYHLFSGSILSGYSFLFRAFLLQPDWKKTIKMGLGWPIKRFF